MIIFIFYILSNHFILFYAISYHYSLLLNLIYTICQEDAPQKTPL